MKEIKTMLENWKIIEDILLDNIQNYLFTRELRGRSVKLSTPSDVKEFSKYISDLLYSIAKETANLYENLQPYKYTSDSMEVTAVEFSEDAPTPAFDFCKELYLDGNDSCYYLIGEDGLPYERVYDGDYIVQISSEYYSMRPRIFEEMFTRVG